MAMGSPLGPTFANIFMCHLEKQFLSKCPPEFKPIFYKRYVDDTFLLFKKPDHATTFLNYVNKCHNNVKFTMDSETDNQLPFLDIQITRCSDGFVTGIFRKETFTGLGLNYFSHCSFNFKINSCKTLLFRAFKLTSSWIKFHEEIEILKKVFCT